MRRTAADSGIFHPMEILVLGPLGIRDRDGRPLAVAARRQRLLLAALAQQAPRAVSADRLIDVQWEDAPPANPGAALQTQVSRLRALLAASGAGDVVERLPHGYRLAVAPEHVDAARFEALLARARDGASPAQALALVEEALALWRGEPYEEFADVRAFAGEIARLRELRTAARERRVELLLTLGRAGEALALVEPLVHEDPLRERPRALQMEAAHRAGRPRDALASYQAFRRLLAEELGLEPSPALRQLELQIIRHEDALAPRMATPARADVAASADSAPAAAAMPAFRLAFAERAGGAGRIAWARAGEGAPLLVLPAWVSSLATIGAGLDPRAPLLAALARRLGLALYDAPGMGLSRGDATGDAMGDAERATTRDQEDGDRLDADVEDAVAVLDAAGIARAPVLAISQAGPVAVALAARHPERVAGLVLLGTYASGASAFPRADVRASVLALIRAHWGLGSRVLAELILPGADGDQGELFARLQREAATPEAAARALERLYAADVAPLLPRVTQPALVAHYTEDTAIPFRAGQELAAGLPDARLVALAGRAHLPTGADAARVAALVADFVQGLG